MPDKSVSKLYEEVMQAVGDDDNSIVDISVSNIHVEKSSFQSNNHKNHTAQLSSNPWSIPQNNHYKKKAASVKNNIAQAYRHSTPIIKKFALTTCKPISSLFKKMANISMMVILTTIMATIKSIIKGLISMFSFLFSLIWMVLVVIFNISLWIVKLTIYIFFVLLALVVVINLVNVFFPELNILSEIYSALPELEYFI